MDEKTDAITGGVSSSPSSKEEAVKVASDNKDEIFKVPSSPSSSNVGRVVSRPTPKTTTVNQPPNQDLASDKNSDANQKEVVKARLASGSGATTDVSNQQRISQQQAARNAEKADLLKQISNIEEEYFHNIGDIPRDHAYWDLLNAYRRK